MVTKLDNGERDLYLDLVREFPLRPIRSEEALDAAISMLDRLSDRESRAPEEEDYLEVLANLVEAYETEHDPEPEIPPARMLKHLIEAKGVPQIKVSVDTGVSESTISEILAGKRDVSRKVGRALGDYFCVDPAIFL